MLNRYVLTRALVLILLLSSCAKSPESCPSRAPVDLSAAAAFAKDDQLYFRFPLDDHQTFLSWAPLMTDFAVSSAGESRKEFHAAEDMRNPAGTPVYAMAAGQVSFSGRMGGYGWLVIVNHPQANLYSLYGHLSPSRWQIDQGPVQKGELLGYLGDDDENGGSAKQPLVPHLHFGVRAGQRADYPGKGEWRWQAGWIAPCPQDLGWLQPSQIISRQEIPVGGFPDPPFQLIEKWGIELLFTGIYLFCGITMLIFSGRKESPMLLFWAAFMMLVVGLVFYRDGWRMSPVLLGISALLLIAGFNIRARQSAARGNI